MHNTNLDWRSAESNGSTSLHGKTGMLHILHALVSKNIFYTQDGEDPQDALSCRSFSTQEPLIVGLLAGNDMYR